MQLKKNWFVVIVVIGLVLVCTGVLYLQNSPQKFSGPLEPVIISTAPSPSSTLILIADNKGFFTRHGLNVTIHESATSLVSMNNLVAGTADIAGATDYAFTTYLVTAPSLKTFASTTKSDVISIVARKDTGIAVPRDLAGKKIGCTLKQAGEFFLARYLVLNSINSTAITVINLQPAEMAEAMAHGTVDAVITWEPYVTDVNNQMAQNAIVFPAQEGQRFYWLMICTNTTAAKRPEMLRNFVAALVDAELYANQYPEDTQQIIAGRLHMDPTYIREVWPKYNLIVSLDQSLIVAMEDETRWMMKNNLTSMKEMPNYLDSISPGGLRSVKPESMNIIG